MLLSPCPQQLPVTQRRPRKETHRWSPSPHPRRTAPAKPELDQDLSKVQKGKGKRGSLENPEVYDNVPGHIIPIIEREFDDFDTEAASFLRGEQAEEQFIGFRLKQGVYGQRQPDVQMCRIKLPVGGVTPEQMDKLAEVVERWAPLNKGHITTRQNIQIHHIPLADMADLIREISSTGLSSREGCGNTMRNVTGDPWAGVSQGEPFDVTPYAGRLRPLLRAPPDHAADAAQGQDRLYGHRRRPRDHRHPRRRLHPQGPRDRGATARSAASRSASEVAPRSCRASPPRSMSSSSSTTATT